MTTTPPRCARETRIDEVVSSDVPCARGRCDAVHWSRDGPRGLHQDKRPFPRRISTGSAHPGASGCSVANLFGLDGCQVVDGLVGLIFWPGSVQPGAAPQQIRHSTCRRWWGGWAASSSGPRSRCAARISKAFRTFPVAPRLARLTVERAASTQSRRWRALEDLVLHLEPTLVAAQLYQSLSRSVATGRPFGRRRRCPEPPSGAGRTR